MAEKGKKLNEIGLSREDYKGKPSTLCLGCGHLIEINKIECYHQQKGGEYLKVEQVDIKNGLAG